MHIYKIVATITLLLTILISCKTTESVSPGNYVDLTILNPEKSYHELVESYFLDEDVSLLEIKAAYIRSDLYNPSDISVIEQFEELIAYRDYDEALRFINRNINDQFANIDFHINCHLLYSLVADETYASYHQDIIFEILESIYATGDGISEESAFQVISIAEEYRLIEYEDIALYGEPVQPISNPYIDIFKVEKSNNYPNGLIHFNTRILY